ncbi:FAD binding domain-containing protein [Biscogniauxia marginata]|nr:FAD binding domain-containing protein [Biscogniauxia marginata]
MTTTKETDILIVGAGPTGLALALELAAQQVSFRIIDKAARRSPHSRAIVVQPRTLEVLRRHGDVGGLLARGTVAAGTTVCVAGRRVADLDLELARIRRGTAFPLPLAVSQRDTEEWLEARLAERGFRAELGVEAREIAQDEGGVTVRIGPAAAVDRGEGGDNREEGVEEIVRAKYVVGADGAHSCVRHAAANMTFEGEAYPQEFILADTRIETQAKTDRAYMCFGRGVMVFLPMWDGFVRLVVSRPANADASPGAAEGLPPARLEDFQDFLNQVFPGGGTLHDPAWLTRFRLHHRGVNRYRDGRLLVAGDAAHIHSPAGGQGMNTGIQDAANLGWKLGAVLRRSGDDGDSSSSSRNKSSSLLLLLDSYHAERHPVGRHLLRNSDASFAYVASTNPVFVYLRNLVLPWVLPWLLASRRLVARQFEFISQLRVRYRHSSGSVSNAIVGTAPGFQGPIRGGDRAADGKIRVAGDGGAEGEGGEKWFQELFSPESHHLVLFSSGGGGGAASEGGLHRAEARFLEHVDAAARVKVHALLSEERGGGGGYVDVGGELHRMYGFEDGAGYVLVRPDGYVAHIGPLSALDGASEWL